jgi:hypothetical protein
MPICYAKRIRICLALESLLARGDDVRDEAAQTSAASLASY